MSDNPWDCRVACDTGCYGLPKPPTDHDESRRRYDAIVADAAEVIREQDRRIVQWQRAQKHWKDRALSAETRLAERDASARRWVKFSAVIIGLLLGAPVAMAQTPGGYQDLSTMLFQQAASCERTANLKLAELQKKIDDLTKERDDLAKAATASEPTKEAPNVGADKKD